MFAHDSTVEEAVHFSRFDKDSPFATVSEQPFLLDDVQWKTPEHYYQAAKYKGLAYANTLMQADDGQQAYDLGNRWWKRKAKDWKKSRQVYMTRALFRKVKEYPEIEQALLATGDALMIETSLYDYYWGLGRDQRGENKLGKIWMDIRSKLHSQHAQAE